MWAYLDTWLFLFVNVNVTFMHVKISNVYTIASIISHRLTFDSLLLKYFYNEKGETLIK